MVAIRAGAAVLLVHELGVVEGVVHLLQCDILSALELDQVLLAVDDLDAAVGKHHPDVAGLEEAILAEDLCGLLRHHVVAAAHVAAPHPDLPAAQAWRAHAHGILGQVRLPLEVEEVGLGVYQVLDAGNGAAHNADADVVQHLQRQTEARLREAVALDGRAADAHPNPLLHLAADRAATRHGNLQLASDDALELVEDQKVKEGAVPTRGHCTALGCEGRVEEELLPGGELGELGISGGLEALPDLGHSCHEGGLEGLQRARGQALAGARHQHLGVGVADRASYEVVAQLEAHLQDVRQGQEGHVAASLDRDMVQEAGSRSRHLRVLDDDALGLARRAGGVHEDGDVVRLGFRQGTALCLALLRDLLEGENVQSLLARRLLRANVGQALVVRVDDGLQAGHVPGLLSDPLHHLEVAEESRHGALIDGTHDSIDPQGGIGGGDDDGLGEGTLHCHEPLGAAVLVQEHAEVALLLVKAVCGLHVERRHAQGLQPPAEVHRHLSDLAVRLPHRRAEDLGRELGVHGARLLHLDHRPGAKGIVVSVLRVRHLHHVPARLDPRWAGQQLVRRLRMPEDLGRRLALSVHVYEAHLNCSIAQRGGALPSQLLLEKPDGAQGQDPEDEVEGEEDRAQDLEGGIRALLRHGSLRSS
mmetsp:Transcript_44828/g.100686  ORF Transcript_44828/g.100686 Transcript_44828/m.100686 type:complete len:646 (+) Transcript_44828:412-2349(+)